MNFYDFMINNYDDDSDENFRNEYIKEENMRIQTKINKHKAEKAHEKTETYIFYVYHEAMLQPDLNDCEACNILNENERLDAHDYYIYEHHLNYQSTDLVLSHILLLTSIATYHSSQC